MMSTRGSRVTAICILIMFGICGCGGASKGSSAAASSNQVAYPAADSVQSATYEEQSAYYDEAGEAQMAMRPESASAGAVQGQPDKIIKSGDIDMETDRFEQAVDTIKHSVVQYGGYIESGSMQAVESRIGARRHYNATLRVPAEGFDKLKAFLEETFKVRNASESIENATSAYYDIQSRLRTREMEEKRVLDMISRATKIDDLINLEQRLGEIRTDIELFRSQVNNIDHATRYATIRINLTEVTSDEMLMVSDNLGQRIANSFRRSVNVTLQIMQEVIIFCAGALIPLCIVAALLVVGMAVIKLGKKKGLRDS